MHNLLISVLAIASTQANICANKTVDVSSMTDGDIKIVEWQKTKVIIYKGDSTSDMPLSPLRQIEATPEWWPINKLPIGTSKSINYYTVFWSPAPTDGCHVMYFPPIKTAKEPGRTPMFVGKKWDGGYVDLCNMLAYNKNGQLVTTDEAHTSKVKKNFTDMLSPPFLVLPNNNVLLKCSPNKAPQPTP